VRFSGSKMRQIKLGAVSDFQLIKPLQTNGRYSFKAEFFGGFDPAVTSNDHIFLVDKHGVIKAKLPDTGSYLAYLLGTVGAGIVFVMGKVV